MKLGLNAGSLVALDEQRQAWIAVDAIASDVIGFLAAGTEAVAAAQELMAAEPAPTAAPSGLPYRPTSLRDFSVWESHMIAGARGSVAEFGTGVERRVVAGYEKLTGRTFPALRPKKGYYTVPQFYVGNHNTIAADGDVIDWPEYSTHLDFELELGLIVAREVRDCTPAQGRAAIGGFVVFNDCTARDIQWADVRGNSLGGMVKAKTFASAMSAVVTTADEINDWTTLTGRTIVNGEVWNEVSASDPMYDLGDMVAYAARSETIEAGALLGTGTFPGGCGLEERRFLLRGDTVRLEIDGIGSVTTTYGSA